MIRSCKTLVFGRGARPRPDTPGYRHMSMPHRAAPAQAVRGVDRVEAWQGSKVSSHGCNGGLVLAMWGLLERPDWRLRMVHLHGFHMCIDYDLR